MASVGLRHVDKLPPFNPRPVEMQVLCLGLSRTSTMSLWVALKKLGYNTYHFMEVGEPDNIKDQHLLCWREALEAKVLGKGKPYGREEFDKVLGRYSAVTDAPNACFADELLEIYPNAKVILSVRDPDKWVASMETSYYRILGWAPFTALAFFDKIIGTERAVCLLILQQWTNGHIYNREKLREGFIRHNQHIRDIVPKGNLFEFQLEEIGGWGPLCEFLGKDIPDEPYPRINEGDNAAKIHVAMFWSHLMTLLGKWVSLSFVVGGLAWGLSWMQQRGTLEYIRRRLMT
ncbi:P-loop containing nucleoside triphosphate hydrolase protein [Rhexocercosporidium sp. MPI-PUGE-AT-0058]|nr:P-loop containing nucleoside triphosphate hydrolase protein [Rhexocercosporidium sp. MPI-PUGE-AT-0058]